MADPSVRLSASASGDADSVAVSITGTPINGELILFYLSWNESPTFSVPTISGFTIVGQITSADWNPLYVFGKIASSEGANPTYTANFTSGTNDGSSVGAVEVWQDASASLPTNVATAHDTSASTTFTFPALTTAANGSSDVVVVTQDGNVSAAVGNYSSWSDSLAEVFDINDGGSRYGAMGVAHVTRATAGTQAAGTVTSIAIDKNVAIRFEIEPAGGGGPSMPVMFHHHARNWRKG